MRTLAWWPYETPTAPPIDAPVFRSWALCYQEASRHRGEHVRIVCPQVTALKVPTGDWDMTGIVIAVAP